MLWNTTQTRPSNSAGTSTARNPDLRRPDGAGVRSGPRSASARSRCCTFSGALPLSLVGESLFRRHRRIRADRRPVVYPDRRRAGAHRAQSEVPRRGRSADVLDQGRLRVGDGSGLRHVLGDLRLGRRRRRGCGPDDHRPAGGIGYPRPYACALVAAGACTGILIPPSIAYIIIGLVLGISASTLFLAALIPGICDPRLDPGDQHHREPLYAWEGGGR
jgi:hypothetical protein